MSNEYRTAEQGISNVEENTYFIILHSLFDIRYWTPCKKHQKQLSAYGVSPLAMCFLPFGPVVERRGYSLSFEKTPLKNEVPLRSTSERERCRMPNLTYKKFKVRPERPTGYSGG